MRLVKSFSWTFLYYLEENTIKKKYMYIYIII